MNIYLFFNLFNSLEDTYHYTKWDIFSAITIVLLAVVIFFIIAGIFFRIIKKRLDNIGSILSKAENKPFKNALSSLESLANLYPEMESVFSECDEEYSKLLGNEGQSCKNLDEKIWLAFNRRKIIQIIKLYPKTKKAVYKYENSMKNLFQKMEQKANLSSDSSFEISLLKNKYVELKKIFSKNFIVLGIISTIIDSHFADIENLLADYAEIEEETNKEEMQSIGQKISKKIKKLNELLTECPKLLIFVSNGIESKFESLEKSILLSNNNLQILKGALLTLKSSSLQTGKQIISAIQHTNIVLAKDLYKNIMDNIEKFEKNLNYENQVTGLLDANKKNIKENFANLKKMETDVNKQIYEIQLSVILKKESQALLLESAKAWKDINVFYERFVFQMEKNIGSVESKDLLQASKYISKLIFQELRNVERKKEILLISKSKDSWIKEVNRIKNQYVELNMHDEKMFFQDVLNKNNLQLSDVSDYIQVLTAEISKPKLREDVMVFNCDKAISIINIFKKSYMEQKNMADEVEKALIIANRYRSKNKTFEHKISEAEKLFEQKNYAKAYEIISNTLFQINPTLFETE